MTLEEHKAYTVKVTHEWAAHCEELEAHIDNVNWDKGQLEKKIKTMEDVMFEMDNIIIRNTRKSYLDTDEISDRLGWERND